MKKGMKALLAVFFLIHAVSGTLAAEKKNRPEIKTVDNYVAVFDFEVTTGDKGISRPLADKVIHEFSMSDKYEVIDRGNMNKILKEQKFQMTGCVAQECKVEAGQILGVGKIVNGSVGIVGKTYYLTLQLIDVKTGKVELSAEDECRCEIDELLGSTRRLAKKLLGEQVEQPVTTAPKPVTVAESKAEAIAKAEAATRAKAEAERVKAEQAARAKAEEERIKAEQAARAKAEEERIKAEQAARAKAEEERIKAEQAARAKAEAERIKAEQAARAKAEAERIKAEQAARAKAEAERIKAEQVARAKAEEERIKAEQITRAKAEEERARAKADEESARAEQITRAKAEAKKHELKATIAVVAQPAVGSAVVASGGRFEKLAGGVVRDTQSGLDWYAGPDKNTDWNDTKQWAAGLRVDGGGWRMPTRTELKSLYQKGAGSRNMTSLLETTGWLIWSGETGVRPDTVWALDFDDGRELLDRRDNSSYKRGYAVRSTPKAATARIDSAVGSAVVASDGRFERLSSGVVRDTQSGLDWYAGPDKNTDWDDAKSWVGNLNIDGGGWRMPTRTELKGLYRKGAGIRNMTPLLETTGWLVWSGETAGTGLPISGSNVAWALDCDYGGETWFNRTDSSYKRVFAVRSTPEVSTAGIDPAIVSTKIVASDGRFEKLASGVVRDTQSGLDWYAGPDKNTDWDDAKSWVGNLNIDGGGWRMPTRTELKGLYRKGAGIRNMTPLLETTGWLVWSGETAGTGLPISGSNVAWALDCDYGGETWFNRTDSSYKRGFAVRSRR